MNIRQRQKQGSRFWTWWPNTATPITTKKGPFQEGDRIPYASRVYDHKEMVNLVDSSLEFWLTSGRYTDEFEKKLADYLGVRFCSLVNSGSSANLVAFMTLTSPLLGERRVKKGEMKSSRLPAGFQPRWRLLSSTAQCRCSWM